MVGKLSLEQNSINYLCDLLDYIPKSILNPTIQSLYLTRGCEIAESQSVDLPELLKSRVRCPRCLIQYANGSTSSIEKTKRPNKFAQKVLNKVKNEKSLTSYQRRCLKSITNKSKFGTNFLVKVCSFCNYNKKIQLQKPQKVIQRSINIPINTKKKRKKDKFAGLNKDVVLNVNSEFVCDQKSELKSYRERSADTPRILQGKPMNAKRRNPSKLKNFLDNFKEKKSTSTLQQFLKSI